MTTDSVEDHADVILDRALTALEAGSPLPITGPGTVGMSERCIEVPWVAGYLPLRGRLLDVGFSMSPPEWMGVLLDLRARGVEVEGIDIIDPQRVQTRYPADMLDDVLSTPMRVQDVLGAEPTTGVYDAMTCVSTLEHIGFDMASPPSDTSTAFIRGATPEEAPTHRDPATDRAFMDAAARLLRSGGTLLLSVPIGAGRPILHQDSLGLFTHQFEYSRTGWEAVLEHEAFTAVDGGYFTYSDTEGWAVATGTAQLCAQSSALQPFATACAVALLERV